MNLNNNGLGQSLVAEPQMIPMGAYAEHRSRCNEPAGHRRADLHDCTYNNCNDTYTTSK